MASGAVADGSDSNALSATVKDAHGNLLSNVDVTFTVTEGAAIPATQTVKTNESGVAQTALVSTVAGDNQVTVTSLGSTPAAKVSSFIAGTADSSKSTLIVSPASIVADGVSSSLVTFTARDANNNPLSGLSVNLAGSGVAHSWDAPVKDNGNGTYTQQLKGTVAGAVTVVPKVGGAEVARLSKVVTFTPGPISATTSTLIASPTSIVADGLKTSQVTFTAKDANNNPIKGLVVNLFGSGVAHSWVAPVKDNGDGTYTQELKGTQAGTVTVVPKVGGVVVEGLSKVVTFVEIPAIIGVSANGYNFAVGAGFPSTGFTGATFTLKMSGIASDYTWTSSAPSWVTVNNSGQVSFTSQGDSSPVTVTATPMGEEYL
ncbi:invasin domain 3-containing protein (plasmid) [Serratia sp. L9]|uniref:invasin domain 3-containing protein n=1 Tax=Serratia sp. L9 TaxID=3423946 RepID=UPI003D674EC7